MLRALWFLSVVVVLANLLIVYASMPEQVVIGEDNAGPQSISKEFLFYTLMISIVLINAMVYLLRRMFPGAEDFRAWFHGLLITINIFLIISMHAVNVYNSTDSFEQSRLVIFVSGSLALILLWAAIWPLYLVYQKLFIKQAI
jgi:hypothetical protein